jgi:hypothetical protein
MSARALILLIDAPPAHGTSTLVRALRASASIANAEIMLRNPSAGAFEHGVAAEAQGARVTFVVNSPAAKASLDLCSRAPNPVILLRSNEDATQFDADPGGYGEPRTFTAMEVTGGALIEWAFGLKLQPLHPTIEAPTQSIEEQIDTAAVEKREVDIPESPKSTKAPRKKGFSAAASGG